MQRRDPPRLRNTSILLALVSAAIPVMASIDVGLIETGLEHTPVTAVPLALLAISVPVVGAWRMGRTSLGDYLIVSAYAFGAFIASGLGLAVLGLMDGLIVLGYLLASPLLHGALAVIMWGMGVLFERLGVSRKSTDG